MIAIAWRDGTVEWFDPTHVQVDGGEERVRRVLSKPARDTEPGSPENLGNAMVEVILKPGTQRHARAALRGLPGARTLFDDGA